MSPHAWLALVPGGRHTLLHVLDGATKRLLSAQLWTAETTEAVMTALREVCQTWGLPMAHYSDRADWAFHTPKAGEPVDRTRLHPGRRRFRPPGIEHIPAYSPRPAANNRSKFFT